MKRETNGQTEKVLTLVLFAVLAVCMILVLLTGAGVYKRLTERGQKSYETRTVPLYLATKVRQADSAGAVVTEREYGLEVLQLKEQIDGISYVTRIYCYEGYVRELFSAETVPFDPTAGEKIAPAAELRFSLTGESLQVTVTLEDGRVSEQMLTLRSDGIISEQAVTLRSSGREAGDEE